MDTARNIELGMLARRERDLRLRLENTRDRIRELTRKEERPREGGASEGKVAGPSGPVAV